MAGFLASFLQTSCIFFLFLFLLLLFFISDQKVQNVTFIGFHHSSKGHQNEQGRMLKMYQQQIKTFFKMPDDSESLD